MSHLIYLLNEYCYRNYGLRRVVSMYINYSWNVQLEIIHWDCPYNKCILPMYYAGAGPHTFNSWSRTYLARSDFLFIYFEIVQLIIFYLYLMLYVCAVRFYVTRNLE
jgi:hypothetical protein